MYKDGTFWLRRLGRHSLGRLLRAAREAAVGAPQGGEPEVFIEKAAEGKPHAGKVLAIIEPHLDDGPIFAGGAVAKSSTKATPGI